MFRKVDLTTQNPVLIWNLVNIFSHNKSQTPSMQTRPINIIDKISFFVSLILRLMRHILRDVHAIDGKC